LFSTLRNVLILSEQIPHSVSAGNIQLLRLFSDYPPEKLLVIGPGVPEGAKRLACRYESLLPPLSRLNTTRFHAWKRTARILGLLPLNSLQKVDRLVGNFQPDLVLSLMEASDYYELAERYARAKGIPLYLIVHDTNEEFEKVFSWAKARQLAKDRRIYRFAKERFCVSPEMAEFNEKRFGVPGKVLYPVPDPEIQARPLEWSKELRQPPYLTIGYAGSMAYGYSEMMLKSLSLLEKAGVRLELCSPKPAGKVAGLLESPIVKWHGYQQSPAEAIRLLQERCDVLWLPYLEHPGENEKLYRTHFPSKLFDYLATGMPVLVSGPAEATGVKWFRKHFPPGAAVEGQDILEYLDRLKRDAAWRSQLAEAVLKKAAEINRVGPEQKRFRQLFHAGQ
jgi:glycosyltransferase involved in cell wall biosynthesis